MIGPEREAEILRLFHAEKWPIGTIAAQLGHHHTTVRRVLGQAGIVAGQTMARPSIVDDFIPFIVETLRKYPRLRASRLYAMARERGFKGSEDHLRHVVSRFRPKPAAEAYQRLRTLPGEQGQVDWAHFGKLAALRLASASASMWAGSSTACRRSQDRPCSATSSTPSKMRTRSRLATTVTERRVTVAGTE
jgi:hypothetical protein